MTVMNLKTKLSSLWKSIGKWGITSLGKGYFEFSFSSIEDVRRVRSFTSWNLNPGFLKLFPWSKDFNPCFLKHSSAQVWIRIHGLPQEYWRPKIVFAIASSVGTPLCTDSASNKNCFERPFGHFVRVLVDLELSQELRYKVLVERKGGGALEGEKPQGKKMTKKVYSQVVKENGAQQTLQGAPEIPSEVNRKGKGVVEDVTNDKDTCIEHDIAHIAQQNMELGETSRVVNIVNTILEVLAQPVTLAEEEDIDSESMDSSFVAATVTSGEVEAPDCNPLLGPVQQDAAFQDTSWHNLANAEIERQGIGDNRPTVAVEDDGFQQVRSKSKSRRKSQRNNSIKNGYSTRSRPGSAQNSP
ncbi:uncharacterized protein LOC131629735 [Vicia villosa]|uniref:uncharacterized protein LOC131629735 n=1 Tax=Vicia villosa TaxID=3911 RepID=UPI00273B6635|nr:uncharacterized protein LOC131629735 [Vicia villosa]